jgi:hypothetical protein
MTRYGLGRFALLLPLIWSIAACVAPDGRRYPEPGPAPTPPTPSARLIGNLEGITGPNAYYVRGSAGPTTRAANGLAVYEGDHIFTGPGTRMTLRFRQGGYAELDENTDPVPRFLSDLGCLIVDLLRSGRMFVDGSAVCVGALGTIARQDSQVVYDVRGGHVQITVAGGRAELRRPQVVSIPAGWRADANSRVVMQGGRAYPLTRAQVEQAVAWTRWYQRTRPALPGTTGAELLRPIPGIIAPKPPPRDVIR